MSWFRRLTGKRRLELELEKELRDHIERQTSDYCRFGLTPEEANRLANLTFGGVEQIREECRDARGTRWAEATWQDLKLAFRGFFKSPGFTLTAVATLALGIGANTAIFALLDAVRLRSLPVPRPHELAHIDIAGGNRFGIVDEANALSYAVWNEIRQYQQGFSGVFAWSPDSFSLGSGATESHVDGLWVSGELFPTLGIPAARGRLFTAKDDQPGCGTPGAVISYAFWQSALAGRESAIGSRLVIRGRPTEIVGITPAEFTGLKVGKSFQLALPVCSLPTYSAEDDELRRPDFAFLVIMGRLRAGWTLRQANDQLASISPAVFAATLPSGYQEFPREGYLKSRLVAKAAPNGVSGLRDTYDTSLWVLLGITGLVLLIACANLANLMLVRASTRRKEMAVRLAIGASRIRLIKQMLTESFLLTTAGAVLGACLARILSRGIIAFVTTERDSLYLDVNLDWRVFTFAAAVATFTCLIFGVVPALRGSQADPVEAIKAGARSTTGTRRRSWFQNALVISQIATSSVLLIAAILFVRSFWNLVTLNPGFREKGIVVASLDLSHVPKARSAAGTPLEWTEGGAREYLNNLLTQLRALPQVASAGTSTHVPLDGSSWTLAFRIAGEKNDSKFTWVSPRYFGTMGKQLLSGRDFSNRDSIASTRVAVVNQTFVRTHLAGKHPLGQTLQTIAEPNYPATEYQIVGVVKDAKYASLREPIPSEVFASAEQRGADALPNIFIRSASPPSAVVSEVRSKLNQISPDIRSNFTVLESDIRDGLVRERLMAVLSGFFGGLSALLAAVGLYGVISYVVTARLGEIGIRLALGATPGSILAAVLKKASVLILGGTVTGLLLALIFMRSARSLLFGLQANDPTTFMAAALVLLPVALVASFVPARRAAGLDPITALRYE
jgi:predicted permease